MVKQSVRIAVPGRVCFGPENTGRVLELMTLQDSVMRRALQIDHVNGGGLHDPHKKTGEKYFAHVVASARSGIYDCLCASCNWIKRHENNEVGVPPNKGKSKYLVSAGS